MLPDGVASDADNIIQATEGQDTPSDVPASLEPVAGEDGAIPGSGSGDADAGPADADADPGEQSQEEQEQQEVVNSGLNEYLDDGGVLIGGIDRLGSLGTDYWELIREREEELREETAREEAEAATLPSAAAIVEPIVYDARGILYAHDVDPENFPNHSLYVRVLDDGKFLRAAPQVSIEYCECGGGTDPRALVNGHLVELALDDTGAPLVDANGYVSFHLTHSALDYFDQYPEETYVEVFFTVTVVENGVTRQYNLQIVIPKDQTFDSDIFDQGSKRGELGPDGLIHGEWHSGTGHSACSGYTTTSSNMNDELYFEGELENVAISGGHASDGAAWGADTVLVNGSLAATGADSEIIMTGLDGEERSTVTIGVDRDGAVSTGTAVSAAQGGATLVEASGDISVNAAQAGVLADDADGTGEEANTLVSGGSITVSVTGDGDDLLGVGATGSGGSNTLRADDSVVVDVNAGGNATGIDGGQTSVSAENAVDVDVSGTESATGVRGEDGDSVSLETTSGDITVAAESEKGTATGIDAVEEGASITIESGADVAVTATAGNGADPSGTGDAWAVRHDGGDLGITGDDVTLGAVSHTGDANGLRGNASAGEATVTAEGKVSVGAETTADGGSAYGVYYEGAQGDATLSGAEVEITAKSVTGTAKGLDGATLDSARVTATAEASGNGLAVAISGAVDRTFIHNADSVTGTAVSGGSAYGNEGAVIETNDAGSIALTGTSSGQAADGTAYGNYQGSLTATDGAVTVKGSNTGTGGANAAYGSLDGTLEAQTVTVTADTANGSAYALASSDAAPTAVTAATATVKAVSTDGNAYGTHGAVDVTASEATMTAEGAATTWAVYGNGGETSLQADALTVNATGTGAETGGMSLTGAALDGGAITVTVTGNTASGTATGIRVTEEAADIDAGTLTATVTGSAATGLETSGAAADIDAGAITLGVTGTDTATGISAGSAGANTADGGTITVDANGVNAATGLNAAGTDAENTMRAEYEMTVNAVAGAAGSVAGTSVAVNAENGGLNTLNGADVTLNAGKRSDDPLEQDVVSYGNATGVHASNATNDVSAGNLDISVLANAHTAGGSSSATGIHAEEAGANTVTVTGELEAIVANLGGSATGVSATGNGGKNEMSASSAVITANGTTAATGLNASGTDTENELTAQNELTVNAVAGVSGTVAGTAVAVNAQNGGGNTLKGTDVSLNAGKRADDPLEQDVISYGNATGVYAANATNEVNAGNLDISVLANAHTSSSSSAATGIQAAANGTNTLTATGSLEALVENLGGTATGASVTGAGALNEMSATTAVITASGTTAATGLNATAGSNALTAETATIAASSDAGNTRGLSATGNGGANTISGTGTVTVTAAGGSGATAGLYAQSSGTNTINAEADGNNTITVTASTTGTGAAAAMQAEQSSGNLTASNTVGNGSDTSEVALTAEATGSGNAYGMRASVTSSSTATAANTAASAGDVTVNATAASGTAYGLDAMTGNDRTFKGTASNTVTAEENATISAVSTRGISYGINSQHKGSVTSVTAGDTVSISATSGVEGVASGNTGITSYGVSHQYGQVDISGAGVSIESTSHLGNAYGITGSSPEQSSVTAANKVSVTAESTYSSGAAYGVYYNNQSDMTITAEDVEIIAKSVHGTARGLSGAVVDTPSLNVLAETSGTGAAYAILGAHSEGSATRTRITNADTVTATARGGGSTYANEGAAIAVTSGGVIELTSESNGSASSAYAYGNRSGHLTAQNGSITITANNTGTGTSSNAYGSQTGTLAAETVDVSASAVGGSAYALNSTNTISAETATLDAVSTAGSAYGTNGETTITAEDTTITATGADRTWGMYNSSGATTVDTDTLTVTATGSGTSTGGLYLYQADIEADTMTITAKSSGEVSSGTAYGIWVASQEADITAGALAINATHDNGNAVGFYTTGGETQVNAGSLNLKAKGGNDATGIGSSVTASNTSTSSATITVDTTASVPASVIAEATGTGTAYGMSAKGMGTASNVLEADHAIITATAENGTAYGMYVSGSGSASNLLNEVRANGGALNVTVTGQGASDDPSTLDGFPATLTISQSCAMYADKGGSAASQAENRITGTAGEDSVTLNGNLFARGGAVNAVRTGEGEDTVLLNGEMYATQDGENLFDAGFGENTVSVKNGMRTQNGGYNTISAGIVTDDLGNTAKDTENNTITIDGGMSARREEVGYKHAYDGGTNSILTGDGYDTVVVNGDVLAYNGGANVINTGQNASADSKDSVTINGSLTAQITNANMEDGMRSENAITTHDLAVNVDKEGTTETAAGIQALGHPIQPQAASNIIDVTGAMNVTVSGDRAAYGMLAQRLTGSSTDYGAAVGNQVTLREEKMTVDVTGTGTSETAGLMAKNGAVNHIKTDNGDTLNMDITVSGATTNALSPVSGLFANTSSNGRPQNLIESSGDLNLNIDVTNTAGRYASGIQTYGGYNTIKSEGKMVLNVHVDGEKLNYRCGAISTISGETLIQSADENDEIYLGGSVTTSGGINRILTGGGDDSVHITGDLETHSENRAANYVNMGSGSDRLKVDGDIIAENHGDDRGLVTDPGMFLDMGYGQGDYGTDVIEVGESIKSFGYVRTEIKMGLGDGTITTGLDIVAKNNETTMDILMQGGNKTISAGRDILAGSNSIFTIALDDTETANANANNFLIEAGQAEYGRIAAVGSSIHKYEQTELNILTNLTEARNDSLTINGDIGTENQGLVTVKTGGGADTVIINGNLLASNGMVNTKTNTGGGIHIDTGSDGNDVLTINGSVGAHGWSSEVSLAANMVTIDRGASTDATADTTAYGLSAAGLTNGDHAWTTVDADHVSVTATSGDADGSHAYGMKVLAGSSGNTNRCEASNTVNSANEAVISAFTGAGLSNAYAMHAANYSTTNPQDGQYDPAWIDATNTVNAASVTLNATATGDAFAMYTGKDITDTAESAPPYDKGAGNYVNAADVEATATSSSGAATVMGSSGGVNVVKNGDDAADTATLKAASTWNGADASVMTAAGLQATGADSSNTVEAANINLTVTAASGMAFGMHTGDGGGVNTLTGSTVSVTVNGSADTYGMYANYGGTNTIRANGDEALTASVSAGTAMHAVGDGSQGTRESNLILGGAGEDSVTVNGNVSSSGNAVNAIDTGAGDDIIILNGEVTAGSLVVRGGDGTDVLVLRGATPGEIQDRYEAWFDGMSTDALNDFSIEIIRVPNGIDLMSADLAWLRTFASANSIQLGWEDGTSPFSLSPFAALAGVEDALMGFGEEESLCQADGSDDGFAMSGLSGMDALDDMDTQTLAEIGGTLLFLARSGDHEDLEALLGGGTDEGLPQDADGNLAESLALESQWTNLCATMEVSGQVQADYYHDDDRSLLLQQELNAITG